MSCFRITFKQSIFLISFAVSKYIIYSARNIVWLAASEIDQNKLQFHLFLFWRNICHMASSFKHTKSILHSRFSPADIQTFIVYIIYINLTVSIVTMVTKINITNSQNHRFLTNLAKIKTLNKINIINQPFSVQPSIFTALYFQS